MNDYGDSNSHLGRRMLWLAAIGLLGGLYLFFSMLDDGGGGMVSSVDSNGAAMVVLEQDRSGHYLSLIHISEPTRQLASSRMPSSA